MSVVQIAQRLPAELRMTMLELVEAVEKDLHEKLAVRREDFDALRSTVHDLAEAQKLSGQRLDRLEAAVLELAEAQKRTEQRVEELAEAQKRSEQRLDRLEAVVQELAEAQKRTEQRVEELAIAQKQTDHTLAQFKKEFHADISAIGARWGWRAEDSFRMAIQSILSEFTDLRVEHFQTYDPQGQVFGRPDQVEIDVVIRNGQVILAEIKSAMSKGDVYTFERKVAFYQQRHKVKVDRKVIITPMLDPRAQPAAEALGIQVFSSAYEFGENV